MLKMPNNSIKVGEFFMHKSFCIIISVNREVLQCQYQPKYQIILSVYTAFYCCLVIISTNDILTILKSLVPLK